MEIHQRPIRAFHNSLAVKAEYLARVEAHRQADDLIRGGFGSATGTSSWRGSVLGCTFHTTTDPYGAAETQIGVPRVLARLDDELFESLGASRYTAWPGQFLQAIPVGADLSDVWPQLAVWLLVDASYGVIRFAQTEQQREAIQQVAALYTKTLAGQEVGLKHWEEAAYAAEGAAAVYATAAAAAAAATNVEAAYAAAATVAAADAYAAADTYRAGVAAAAAAAADAAVSDAYYDYDANNNAARSATYERIANKLLALLANAPVG